MSFRARTTLWRKHVEAPFACKRRLLAHGIGSPHRTPDSSGCTRPRAQLSRLRRPSLSRNFWFASPKHRFQPKSWLRSSLKRRQSPSEIPNRARSAPQRCCCPWPLHARSRSAPSSAAAASGRTLDFSPSCSLRSRCGALGHASSHSERLRFSATFSPCSWPPRSRSYRGRSPQSSSEPSARSPYASSFFRIGRTRSCAGRWSIFVRASARCL